MNIPHAGGRRRKPGGCGATKHCVYGTCNSDSRRNSTEYTFHTFPKACLKVRQKYITPDSEHLTACNECQKCMLWIIKCGREDGRFEKLEHVKRYSYICSKHFVIKELFDQYPYPLPEDLVERLNETYRNLPMTASTNTDFVTNSTPTSQGFKRRKIDSSTPFNVDETMSNDDDDRNMIEKEEIEKVETKFIVKIENNEASMCEQGSQTESIEMNMCETGAQTELPVKLYSKGTQTVFKRYDYNKLQEELVQVKKQNRLLKNELKKKHRQCCRK